MSTSTFTISGVDFVYLPVKDFDESAKFYGDVLGLECSVRYGGLRGGEFETGNLTLQLVEAEKIGREVTPGPNPIALHVDDVEAARAELESHGVEFLADTMDSGVCHMAFFADPDGNALCLHHRYAPRS
jgi:predicted enzyme related to lactoylglutathione lyase